MNAVEQSWGGARRGLRLSDLRPCENLIRLFDELYGVLKRAGHTEDESNEILHKLLLVKIFDEQVASPANARPILQDFSKAKTARIERAFDTLLARALEKYRHFPIKSSGTMGCAGRTLRQLAARVCRVNFISSPYPVVSAFVVHFGKIVYGITLDPRDADPLLQGMDVNAEAAKLAELNLVLHGIQTK